MTRGIVIFAYANELIDYVALAAWSTRNIHRHLGLPVCVITDQTNIPVTYEFDQVIQVHKQENSSRYFADFKESGSWYNHDRMTAYALSPWDQTLVLDADYVVAGDQLKVLFDVDVDFLAHDHAYDVAGGKTFAQDNWFGRWRMPMTWATVMRFNRGRTAGLIFDAMQMIRDNWTHYMYLYGVSNSAYRNDYALTIAQLIVNGQVLDWPCIPWSLATVLPEARLTRLADDHYRVDFQNASGQARWITLDQDFHAMGKKQLGELVAHTS
jgi:hypothetical protein